MPAPGAIIDQYDGKRVPTNLCVDVLEHAAGAPTVGVLALQGGFHEHKVMLSQLGARVLEVRQPKDLEVALDGLVIPGGESTTMAHLARRLGLLEPLRAFVASGKPVMGTCAGLIFLADTCEGQKTGGQELVGGLDVTVHRNYFGSQVDSFTTELRASFAPERDAAAVFIRAPAITRVGPGVEVLCSIETSGVGLTVEASTLPVAVQQGSLIGIAFHPELTTDGCWHAHFMGLINRPAAVAAKGAAAKKSAPAKAAPASKKRGRK